MKALMALLPSLFIASDTSKREELIACIAATLHRKHSSSQRASTYETNCVILLWSLMKTLKGFSFSQSDEAWQHTLLNLLLELVTSTNPCALRFAMLTVSISPLFFLPSCLDLFVNGLSEGYPKHDSLLLAISHLAQTKCLPPSFAQEMAQYCMQRAVQLPLPSLCCYASLARFFPLLLAEKNAIQDLVIHILTIESPYQVDALPSRSLLGFLFHCIHAHPHPYHHSGVSNDEPGRSRVFFPLRTYHPVYGGRKTPHASRVTCSADYQAVAEELRSHRCDAACLSL